MNDTLKKALRPILRKALSGFEWIIGFRTDPTGYEPSRISILSGKYERFLTDQILTMLPANGTFVDVGANIGYISYIIAKARPIAKNIIAIEPNPKVKEIIKYNLERFPSVKIFHFGLGSKEGNLEFYQGSYSEIGSFVKGYNESFMSHATYNVESISIPVQKGDVILSWVESIDVLKVDVEGFEMEVFIGLSNMIKAGRIKAIFFEYNILSQKMTTEIEGNVSVIQYLQEYGYEITGIEGDWKNIKIDQTSLEDLTKKLGPKGYTTLLAKKL